MKKVKKLVAYKFIPFSLTKENIERPVIAKDKHKMKLAEMKDTLKILKILKNELATRQSTH